MPKLIDQYVLEEKIGAGQFGDVYYGFHQHTKQEVAIKTIKRQTIKGIKIVMEGKFYELLENQIKVLKTCDNPNIIKLYAIKKTANHFYLMMEYCNDGDMLQRVKKHGKVPEQDTIKYLCQILNAFQFLTKHKIMHRDFKLANILIHDGSIKIADFGFAKLLNTEDYATTMLGSPLNMAPEVLGGNKYNSKADIWSIGACVYEMLFGKPPYIASNLVDLLKLIKSKPLSFPSEPKINDSLKQVLKRMLVVDPKRRISWSDLFSHPINRYLDNLISRQINLQLTEDQSLVLNTSKFYLKKNLVIDNPASIQENEEVNEYLRKVIKEKDKKQEYKAQESQSKSRLSSQSESKMNLSQISRKNSKKILHYRNIYAFLASVADEILNQTQIQGNQIAAYVMVRKILSMISWLKIVTSAEQCPLKQLQNWSQYMESPELNEIKEYIAKQYDVFNVFNESLEPIIKQNFLKGNYENDVKQLISGDYHEKIYQKYLKIYIKRVSKKIVEEMLARKQGQPFRNTLKHIQCILVAYESDLVFGEQDFDFKAFQESFEGINIEDLLLRIERMLKQIL